MQQHQEETTTIQLQEERNAGIEATITHANSSRDQSDSNKKGLGLIEII